MKSELFLVGLQNHDWWSLIGILAVQHMVVNAKQRIGEEENGILFFKGHTPPLFLCENAVTWRNSKRFSSSTGWKDPTSRCIKHIGIVSNGAESPMPFCNLLYMLVKERKDKRTPEPALSYSVLEWRKQAWGAVEGDIISFSLLILYFNITMLA